MNDEMLDFSEKVADWIDSTGYEEDISAIAAGIADSREGFVKVYEEMLPQLIRLDPAIDKDRILDVVIDLLVELEHIGRHMFDSAKAFDKFRAYIGGDNAGR